MNMTNESMACEVQEIPAEFRRHKALVEDTFELLKQLEEKISPVLSPDRVKPCDEKAKEPPRLGSQMGVLLNDQNGKIESINETLRGLCQRVRL